MYSTIAASLCKKATIEMHTPLFFLLDIIYADLFIVEFFIYLRFYKCLSQSK